MSIVEKSFQVFLHNVPWTMGRREVARYCSQFGKVLGVTIQYNLETGMHNRWAFVRFGTRDGKDQMMKSYTHFAEGSVMRVQERSN